MSTQTAAIFVGTLLIIQF